jgi:hypothetical protein
MCPGFNDLRLPRQRRDSGYQVPGIHHCPQFAARLRSWSVLYQGDRSEGSLVDDLQLLVGTIAQRGDTKCPLG